MALYDVPVHTGYKILTHTSSRRFARNGLSQVGNRTLPTHPINPAPVMASSIFNKNLALRGTQLRGISEAGYGKLYPNYGLSSRSTERGDPGGWGLRYAGAGSPRTSLAYSGAGSPRTSLAYSGAGSPRTSLRYAGAGSPRTSLNDAYINDNPPPGTLGKIGIPGRKNSIRGYLADSQLADDAAPTDSGTTYGPAAPTVDSSGGVLSTLENAFGSLFSTTISTASTAGTLAANNAVANAISGNQTAAQKAAAALAVATNPTTILGMSVDTLMILGLGVGAWYYFKG